MRYGASHANNLIVLSDMMNMFQIIIVSLSFFLNNITYSK